MGFVPLFNIPFLAAAWDDEYQRFRESQEARALRERLRKWAERDMLKETSSESAFLKHFFCDTWGYTQQAESDDQRYECYPRFPVARAGETGSTGVADLALGNFGSGAESDGIPQVLCEFKDIRSALDREQHRKGNTRSPVDQCLRYLWESHNGLTGHEPVTVSWGIVTDMNEFRLYHYGDAEYQRFVIRPEDGDDAEPLTADTQSAEFMRFLFWKTFHRTSLLSERGPCYLENLRDDQLIHEGALEKQFYMEYRAYREHLYRAIAEANPGFEGTRGKLVRLTQRLLDRCIFIMFCEDMGKSLDFPGDLLRNVLIDYSKDAYYNAADTTLWQRIKTLFTAMQDGGVFGDHRINQFNGGLFEQLPELERLDVPSRVFCARGQGAGGMSTLLKHPLTLLYFSAKYNFGIKDAGKQRVIDLYALGRIFEQSITELEILEAEADGRPSLNKLSKRKRDGVYYTPEWVTKYIVDETVGARLRDIKAELGLAPENAPGADDIRQYLAFLADRRKAAPVAGSWMRALDDYRERLERLKVVDPACGSGAFLVQALDRLKAEHQWVSGERQRIVGSKQLWDAETTINSILNNNLYGVDINAESVEITKLALWLHTASPGKPLSRLNHTIRCGNSLVAPDFYADRQGALFSEEERERVNAFDWKAAFPEVFAQGGFDCVIGNPPYIKLQHFRRLHSDVAEYLRKRKPDGSPLYESTQTGNFDMYLPFIEKGVDLLKPEGRMGYIAPNVWLKNKYGEGLRSKLKRTRRLDRWVDFKSFQVFDEATTYTALQFFRGKPVEAVRCVFAPKGDVNRTDWLKPDARLPYDGLPVADAWNFLPDDERSLVARLGKSFGRLDDSCWTRQIFQGVITSADHVYHLERLTSGTYRTKDGDEVRLEETLMRPLVSGPEAKRYVFPSTTKCILFPYDLANSSPCLISKQVLESEVPRTFAYIASHERELRSRENARFDDDAWYRFGRNQNIDKQDCPKLCVAQTVPHIRVFYDARGDFVINNVRVNGILPKTDPLGWFLLGVLNAPVADFVFRRIAKPKDNDYFEANKQFIAPLPIPDASDSEAAEVGATAEELQRLHTNRRNLTDGFQHRLDGTQVQDDIRKENWLWADVGTTATWKQSDEAPGELTGRELTAWARGMVAETISSHYNELDRRLHAGASVAVENTDDAIRVMIDGRVVIEVFDEPDTPFVAAQWRHKTRDLNVTEKFTGKRLVDDLLKLKTTENRGLRDRLVALDAEIAELEEQIADAEDRMNAMVYRLYGLSDEEIRLVENG